MDYRTLIDVARGNIPADLVIKNVTMLMLPAGEWIRGDIAVAGDRIAGAGTESYEGRKTFDGSGFFAVPGFIDAHVHVESSLLLPSAFEAAVLPCGTTTAICDPHELANVCGSAGIRFFLESAEKMSMDLIVQMCSCVPATSLDTAGAVLTAEDLVLLRKHPCAGGLSEMMDIAGVLGKDPAVLAKIASFADAPVDGHAPSLNGRDLNAYCSCGIGNDHECSSLQDAKERIRRGIAVLIREGSAAKNLKILAPLVTPATVDYTALCTDDLHIRDIMQNGHINGMIRALIAEGIAPELAYRAASLSAARCFQLPDRGMLAPGKLADIVLLDDVRQCRVHTVFKRGREVGPGMRPSPVPDYTFALHSIKRAPVRAEDFRILSAHAETPVIEVREGNLTTQKLNLMMEPDGSGEKHPLPEKDVAKICVISRYGDDSFGRGFVRGFGLQSGAIATSISHDSHNICVVGTNDADMAEAANALIRCGGGFTAVKNGEILALVPFPVGGLMSDKSGREVASEMKTLYCAIRKTGCRLSAPCIHLSFLTLTVIPYLKITDKGVYDTEKSAFVEV